MIFVVNVFKTDPEKREQAADFLTRLARYNNAHGVECKFMVTLTGTHGDFMLLHTYDSVEHWGRYLKEVREPGHEALMKEYQENKYFPESYERHVWSVVDLNE